MPPHFGNLEVNIPNPEAQCNTKRAKMALVSRDSQSSPRPPFAQRLFELRKRSGLTQEQLGKIVGVAGPTISGYESGASHITVDELPKFADALGATPADFFRAESGERVARGHIPRPVAPDVPSMNLWPVRDSLRSAGLAESDSAALIYLAERLASRENGA
jgi:transcriptional regulator with XRE-family HTH domain